MFLASQFDKYINCTYTMSAANQKSFRKFGGRAMKLKKKEKHMNNQDYLRYIFWIALTAILLSTLTGN